MSELERRQLKLLRAELGLIVNEHTDTDIRASDRAA
jgi:hypothetical protein